MAVGPKILAVVPARFASTRFPAKVIVPILGKPLVVHTYERALAASLVSEAVVATDDDRVAAAIEPFGVRIMMTRADHPSGTDRAAEVAANSDADIIVNVQGDEPTLDPQTIDAVIRPLLEQADVQMSTARHPLRDPEAIADPNQVKVVVDARGLALYFSRCPIPHIRDSDGEAGGAPTHWKHIGLYAYRRDFLLRFAQLPQTPLEEFEKLEQLRALEHGYKIAVVDTEYVGVGVDVPEDLELVERLLAQRLEDGNV